MMKPALFLALLALSAIPAGASEADSISGEGALGEKLQLGTLQVRPLRVIEDQRCPAGVACSSPDRIIVRTEIRGRSTNKVRDFEIGHIRQVEESGSLVLVAVTPSPAAGATIDPAAYRFSYEFTR